MKLSLNQIDDLIEDGVISEWKQRILFSETRIGWTSLEFRVGQQWFTCMTNPHFGYYFGFCPVTGWVGNIPEYSLKNEINQEEPIEFLKSYM